MPLLHTLSYGAIVAAFAFVVLSLASGLLWISELIEENTRTAKVVGKRSIYVIIALHVLLYFADSLPLPRILFSIFCHIVYLQNFSESWPVITLTAPSFLASCLLVVIDHFLWFFYFAKITHDARQRSHSVYGRPAKPINAPGFGDIATFFIICIWFAPLFLFLSLSINDNALPTMSASGTHTPVDTRARSSLFRSILGFSRRDKTEGIIAPPSPGLRPMNSNLSVPSLHDIPSRPLSPGLSRPPMSPRASMEGDRPIMQRSITNPPANSTPPIANAPFAVRQTSLDVNKKGLEPRRVTSPYQ